MEEFKRLFLESLPFIKEHYAGLLYFGTEGVKEGYYGLWEEEGTLSFEVLMEEDNSKEAIEFIKQHNLNVTDDWNYFNEYSSLIQDDYSLGLIAQNLNNNKTPLLKLMKALYKAPRYYYQSNNQAIKEGDFFFNFGTEKQFCQSSKKKMRQLRRWLRNKKYVTTRFKDEKVFIMIEQGSGHTLLDKEVGLFLQDYFS